ncbi:MAG: transposase [Leptolyngbyaceae bacterium]|nr:transposase [Leptolyngbyaceae bacterium]
MTLEKTWVGIDVSKDSLDGYLLPQGTTFQVPNNEAGIQELIAQFQSTPPHLVVVESTGGLERTLVGKLHQAAIPVAIAPNITRDQGNLLRFRHSQHCGCGEGSGTTQPTIQPHEHVITWL